MDKKMTKESIEVEDVNTECCGGDCGCESNKVEAQADK